jgi:hypothetical protein
MSMEEAGLQHVEACRDCGSVGAKGLCTKQDLYDIITELRRKNPHARIPEIAFPKPNLSTETENQIIDGMLELLNKDRLTLHQSVNLLGRLGWMIEWGSEWRRGRRTIQESVRGSRYANWRTS